MIEERLNQDLKQALLSGDKQTVSALRTLKSTILYAKVAEGSSRTEAMADAQLVSILQKEAKKRQESADLYIQGGSAERAQAELTEKRIIEKYLPVQLDEAQVSQLVAKVLVEFGDAVSGASIGQVIGKVKDAAAGAADGALIARIVKERLQK